MLFYQKKRRNISRKEVCRRCTVMPREDVKLAVLHVCLWPLLQLVDLVTENLTRSSFNNKRFINTQDPRPGTPLFISSAASDVIRDAPLSALLVSSSAWSLCSQAPYPPSGLRMAAGASGRQRVNKGAGKRSRISPVPSLLGRKSVGEAPAACPSPHWAEGLRSRLRPGDLSRGR